MVISQIRPLFPTHGHRFTSMSELLGTGADLLIADAIMIDLSEEANCTTK